MSRILLCFLIISSFSYAEKTEEVKPDKLMVYKKTVQGDLKLHIFYPKGHKASDKRPVVVFFFGGAWVKGTAKVFYEDAKYLADRGMVAISADYRIKTLHKTTPKECVKDGKSAIRFIRKNAKILGINPNKIAAGGGSAGGHVATATATNIKFEEKNENKKISSRPNALVLYNPVYDNSKGSFQPATIRNYWKEISPFHNMDKRIPPTIVFLGSEDKHLSVARAKEFQQKMLNFKVKSELHIYEGESHSFFSRKPELRKDILKKIDKFFVSLQYLKKPKKKE